MVLVLGIYFLPVSSAIKIELEGQFDRYCQRHHMKKSTFAALALEQYLRERFLTKAGMVIKVVRFIDVVNFMNHIKSNNMSI
jgi:hypothetical protein